MLTSCSGDSESDPVNMNPSGCSSAINNVSVSQNSEELHFTITASAGALYYETSISPTSQNYGPESGTIRPLEAQTNSLSLMYGYEPGDVVVYVRSVCADNSKGEWFGPKLVTIEQFCGTPTDLDVTPFGVTWNYPPVTANATTFQVQYGPAGFSPGSGTIATVTNNHYSDASLSAGQAYDFYVRAFCTNGVGYGNWEGPFNYVSETNQNMCLAPTNIAASSGGGGYHTFTFNPNGEDHWEYTLVQRDENVTSGILYTRHWNDGWPTYNLGFNGSYDFYVRAVCNDGSRTAWALYEYNL